MVLKVTQLKNGSYLVIHKTDAGNGYENSWSFQCKGQAPTFKFHYSFNGDEDEDGEFDEDSTVKAWLEAVPNGLASDRYPETVSAFLDDEVREMTKISSNKWSEVEWPYQPSRVDSIDNYYCRDEIQYEDVTLGLILTFKSASETNLANQYAKVLENQKMGDVKFILQGQEMTAHSDILVAASPVMSAMLEPGKFVEGQTKTVHMSDMEPAVFQQLLTFIYTGSAPRVAEESITEPLFLAADMYQLDTLKAICEEGLIQHLNLDNAVKYLLSAQFHLLPQLQEAATNVLVKHRQEKELWDQPEWKELVSQDSFFEISCKMMADED